MGSYPPKSSPPASSHMNSSPRSFNTAGCPPPLAQFQKDALQSQAANHSSPRSSYQSPKLDPATQSMEPHGVHTQRGGGGQTASTPTRGDGERHLKVHSSPANAAATSSKNSSSGGVPYSHFRPHPGLGHQGPPASSTSVPQQQHSDPHEAWRYPSGHSLVSTSPPPPAGEHPLPPVADWFVFPLGVGRLQTSRCATSAPAEPQSSRGRSTFRSRPPVASSRLHTDPRHYAQLFPLLLRRWPLQRRREHAPLCRWLWERRRLAEGGGGAASELHGGRRQTSGGRSHAVGVSKRPSSSHQQTPSAGIPKSPASKGQDVILSSGRAGASSSSSSAVFFIFLVLLGPPEGRRERDYEQGIEPSPGVRPLHQLFPGAPQAGLLFLSDVLCS